jgi:hypothetical protein
MEGGAFINSDSSAVRPVGSLFGYGTAGRVVTTSKRETKTLRHATLTAIVVIVLGMPGRGTAEEGWTSLFDGKTFNGWKASENTDSWTIEDGALVCHGPRSHLFYMGDLAPFVDFEWKSEVMTKPGSNSGIYFHTRYQQEGWPQYGYEVQVNNTHKDPKKTGGLYAVSDVFEAPAKDDEWFEMHIAVQGKRIVVKVDGKTVVDYSEPEDGPPAAGGFHRVLDKGTFALQAHDPNSKVCFKNIRVKKLPPSPTR